MEDNEKTKEQIMNELIDLRKKITELNKVKVNGNTQDESKLPKSKEFYRLIAENTGDVITLHDFNLQATYRYAGPSLKDASGYEPEELIGKSPFEFIHPDDKKKLFPILKNYVSAKLRRTFTGKELPTTKRVELRFKDKKGGWRYLQITGNIIGNQLLFATRDITDQKKAEDALRKSQQEFASLFKSSPEALVYTDEKSDILDINPRFTELFGYTLEEIKGRNLDDGMIHSPDKIEEGKELGRIAKSKGYFTHETIRKKKDGTLFPVSISGSNITIDGQLKGMLVIYIDTTERKNMLDKLRKNEEKYRNLFQNMPGAYYRTDKDGNLIMINPEGAKLFGYNSPEDILGKNISQHLYFAPEERKKYLKELEKNKGNLKDFELTLKKKDGTPLIISDTSHLYYDEKENIAGVEGIFVDITERVQNEKLQQALYNISNAANSPISLNQLYKTIHQELGNIIDTKNFHIALLNKEKNKIHFDYFFDEKDDISVTLEYNNTGSLSGYAIKTEQPLLVNRQQINKMIERGELILSHLGTLTEETLWLGVPLKIEGIVIGTMAVLSYTNSHLYSEKDIKIMEFVSSQVATAIKRKQDEEALYKSQQEFASLFKNIPEALIYTDKRGNILYINPRFTEVFGYALDEIKGKNIDEGIIHTKEQIDEGKYYTKKSLNHFINYETYRKRKDGIIFPVSITASSIKINNKVKGIITLYQDITERKRNDNLQKVLYNISQAANSSISLKQLYKTIHKELGTIIDTTNFYIALVDKKEDKIYFPYHQDEKDDNFPILNFSTSNTLTAYVIKTGKPLLNNNSQYEEMVNQKILFPKGSTSPQSIWLGVPLKIEDWVIGAMAVQSYTNPELYTEGDIKLLEFVSSQIATAIERKSSEERIKHLSFHDSLTGLYNRAYFEEELERYNFPRYYPFSIVMLDVNGLKVINDTFGHHEGDRLLQHLSQVLASVSRQGDILARIGGDEFAILLPSTTSEQAHEFCERIKETCQQDKIKPIYLRPNISLGHATQKGEYKDINSLLKEADRNMYQDKLFNGKSREKHFLEAFRIVLAERDPHTSDHAHRLQELALSLGEKVGLTEYQLGNLKLLALLHDMGKIGIPDSILFKTYILTPSEWEKMREHSRIGYRMAKNIPDFAPIAQEILHHHEHWDGTGYPDGLKEEKIPLLSRIISIIDAYDVMQSRRLYKGAISKTEALKEIKRCAGSQFDPQLVEIFLKIENGKK